MIVILSKYILVGLANTLLTLTIIFILTYLHFNLYIANAIGYSYGILLSFILNSFFTFSVNFKITRLIKFLITCLICYFINITAINFFLIIYPTKIYLAQLFGMGLYTITGFIINKLWAMK